MDNDLASTIETPVCIVGAGPAGMILALVLARAGVGVHLLESHLDFDRDFRGDTVHPSTLEILEQLGLIDAVLRIPHGYVRRMRVQSRDELYVMADLTRLKTKYPYVLMVPQVKLLDLLAAEGRKLPNFHLVLGANVQRLVEDGGAVRGVRYRDGDNKWHEVRAPLTVAADGRFSKLRHLAGIEPVKTAPPMDVVWFRLPKLPGNPTDATELNIAGGRFAVVLDRGDQWQVGYVILKGSFSTVRSAGIEQLQRGLTEVVPWLAENVKSLTDWNQVAILNVESTLAPCWHKPGLLLIGDAAHAMSPVGGVGINVAVQDAVVAANRLAGPLKRGSVTDAELAGIQAEREPAVRTVQRIQRMIQTQIAAPGLDANRPFRMPWWIRLALKIPGLRDMPAKMIAFGPRRVRVEV
jgi:2-polyprenyl-6-methoxyphenol hydroxylase-like FAD-dependent oxidoreductase